MKIGKSVYLYLLYDFSITNLLTLFLKSHAHRIWNVNFLTGRSQFARFCINCENDYRIGVLIRGKQKLAGRVNGEIARRLPLSGLMLYGRQFPGLPVNFIDNDTIVPSV